MHWTERNYQITIWGQYNTEKLGYEQSDQYSTIQYDVQVFDVCFKTSKQQALSIAQENILWFSHISEHTSLQQSTVTTMYVISQSSTDTVIQVHPDGKME